MATTYEFLCDRIIPGCTHTEVADSEEEARKKATQHLKEHHRWETLDHHQTTRINMAVVGIHR